MTDIIANYAKKFQTYGKKNEAESKFNVVTDEVGGAVVCGLVNYSFKDDAATMEAPIFSLSTQEDKQVWIWTSSDGTKTVEVKPSFYGRATIFDKDLLIFAASHLTAEINKGNIPSRTITFTTYSYFKATGKSTSGTYYERFKMSLERLKGTTITTNIKTGNIKTAKGFGIIDDWEVCENSDDHKNLAISVTLSKWLYNAIVSQEVLTISPDYFKIRKPLERRLYEIARKHVGKQKQWSITFESLQKKCGSVREPRKFRSELKSLCESNNLPEYLYKIDNESGKVIFTRK